MDASFLNNFTSETPLINIRESWMELAGVNLLIKREDLIHPQVSGNKWRKLKYNLIEARKRGATTLLTFGGAFSNHIYATAAAGIAFGFKTIGIIRGEKPQKLNSTLQFAIEQGMHLEYVSRSAYRDKNKIIAELPFDFSTIYVLPEGGTNSLALKGCAEIITETQNFQEIDFWTVSCGTGGTLAGMATAVKDHQKAIGFSALKGDFLTQEVKQLLDNYGANNTDQWSINTNFHFGGYAKFNQDLVEFINDFKQRHQIQLDPIYTGKMLFGVYDLIKKEYFKKGTTIVAVHTGGQQGIEGFNQRFGQLIN